MLALRLRPDAQNRGFTASLKVRRSHISSTVTLKTVFAVVQDVGGVTITNLWLALEQSQFELTNEVLMGFARTIAGGSVTTLYKNYASLCTSA